MVGVVLYVVVLPEAGTIGVVAFEVAFLVFWYLFFKNTVCDFQGRNGPCSRDSYGKLRGCGVFVSHSRGKRAALLDALNLANPENAFRVTWSDDRTAARTVPLESPRARTGTTRPENRSQARFNLLSLVVATIGSTAGVLALFIGPGS